MGLEWQYFHFCRPFVLFHVKMKILVYVADFHIEMFLSKVRKKVELNQQKILTLNLTVKVNITSV